jgi:hypothetical protein
MAPSLQNCILQHGLQVHGAGVAVPTGADPHTGVQREGELLGPEEDDRAGVTGQSQRLVLREWGGD